MRVNYPEYEYSPPRLLTAFKAQVFILKYKVINSVLNQYVANRVRIVLHRVYLLVHCPAKRLPQLGSDLAHPGHVLRAITRIVGENHADEVFARK